MCGDSAGDLPRPADRLPRCDRLGRRRSLRGRLDGTGRQLLGRRPLAAALHSSGYALLGAFVSLLLLDAILSPGAAGYIYLGNGARVGYGLAVNGFFPSVMAKVNRHGVPAVSAVVSFGVGCLFFLPAPSWYRLVGFISSALILSTLAASVALVVFRRTAPDLPRPFRLPAAHVFAPAGFVAATVINLLVRLHHPVQPEHDPAGGMVIYSVCYSARKGWSGGTNRRSWQRCSFWVGVCHGPSGYLLAPASVPAHRDPRCLSACFSWRPCAWASLSQCT
ncbi:APC family permease [Rhodococcus opacus]|nr:APC family permease [Rhodococcus opacus]